MIDEGRLRPGPVTLGSGFAEGTAAAEGVVSALGQPIELGPYRDAIGRGHRPRHVLIDLADGTGGSVVTAHGARPGWGDRLGGMLVGGARDWWVARQALGRSSHGYVHANGEAIGFALLLLLGLRPSRSVRVGFWVMSPDGPRVRLWLRLMRWARLRPLLVAESAVKADAIRHHAGSAARIVVLKPPVDLDFFSPGTEPSSPRARPLVASAGLEQRDYVTLAVVAEKLDVEVVVCAVSPDAASTSARVPEVLPANMRFAELSIEELRDLYRRADVVVVPTVANTIDAGASTVVEAMACGRPLVVTAQGMYREYAAAGVLTAVPVASVDDLFHAIDDLLHRPEVAGAMGRAARARIEAEHDDGRWRADLLDQVRRGGLGVAELAAAVSPRPGGPATGPD